MRNMMRSNWLMVSFFLVAAAAILLLPLGGILLRTLFLGNIPPIDPGPPGGARLGSIEGRVWAANCAAVTGCGENGQAVDGKYGLLGVMVRLGAGSCPATEFAITQSGPDGGYIFNQLPAGDYCVSVDLHDTRHSVSLQPGAWIEPVVGSGVAGHSVRLVGDQALVGLDFGWIAQPPPTPIPSAEPPTPAPTATLVPDRQPQLGEQAFYDSFTSGANWALYEDKHVRFKVRDGRLEMTALNADHWDGWLLTWPTASRYYLELEAVMGDCSGLDRYGVMFNAGKTDLGYTGTLFGISCDGRYGLRRWDGERSQEILAWTSTDALRAGAHQMNRIGIQVEPGAVSLFANGQFLTQVPLTYDDGDRFGLFVGAVRTPGLTVQVEELTAWDLR